MSNKFTTRIIISLICVLILIVLIFNVPKFFNKNEQSVGRLENWYYTDDMGNKFDIIIPQKMYQDKHGYTEIFTVLPEDFHGNHYICFWTFYQSVKVYIDNELIYDYDNSETDSFGEAATSKWNFVEIKNAQSSNRLLRIEMHTPYRDINFRLTEVVYGDLESIHSWLEGEYGVLTVIETAILWIGVLFILLAFIQKVEKRYKLYQLYAGIILILFSIYLRTGTKTLPIYWMSNYMKEFLCFFCLLLLSLPLTLYIKTKVMRKPSLVAWCNILAVLEIATAIVLFFLHGIGVRDLHRSVGIGLMWLFAAVITGIVYTVYYMAKERTSFVYLTLVSLSLMIIVLTVEYLQFYQLSTLPFDTGFLSHMGALAVVGVEAAIYVYYLNNESKKASLVHLENKNLQIQMLTSQIRPHFILNTIGAIRTLIKEDGDRASNLLYEFSKYIRNNLEQKDYTKPVPFLEELDYIETYLSLERARFGDVIDVVYDIGSKNFWVLPLTIQPFVENAIKHGLSTSESGGVLTIRTKEINGSTLIEIKDNGVGFNVDTLERKLDEKRSVGMRSAIMRLEKGMNAKVVVSSSMNPSRSGTCIRIEIPKKIKEVKNENHNS